MSQPAAEAGANEPSGADGAVAVSGRTPTGLLLAYASGSPGMGVWVAVPGLLFLYYMTQILDVAPEVAGLALLIPKALDVVMHPFFGTVSDRLRQISGHRRQMMWIGLLLAFAMIAAFSTPAVLSGNGAAIWVACFYTLGNILFASFQVPYLTTPSDLNISYFERTRVMTYRTVALTIGLVVVGGLAPALVASRQRSSYTEMAVIMAVIMVISGVVAIVGVRRLGRHMTPATAGTGHRAPLIRSMRTALSDRNFRILVMAYVLTVTVTHLFLAGAPFFARYYFDSEGFASVLTVAFLLPAVFAGPVWLLVSRRTGKQRGILAAQVIFVVAAIALYFGPRGGIAVSVLIIVVLGIAFAGMQLFAYAMLPDITRAGGRDSSQAATYTGVWSATEAAGTALGPYVYSTVLAIGGFVSSSSDETIQQSPEALSAMLIGFTILPAILMLAAFLIQRFYALRPEDSSGPVAATIGG